MDIKEVRKDMTVEGFNMDNKYIKGKVFGIVGLAGVALVKTGEDRLDITHAYAENLKEVE